MRNQRGFSLLELIVVLGVLFVVTGAIFQMMNTASQRSSVEQAKLDMFQEAREFMDQMSRDLRQAGYPSPVNFTSTTLTASPAANDTHAAAGLVKVSATELQFEGDVGGVDLSGNPLNPGTVSEVHYYLDTSTANGCPCLRRSQVPKITGDPLSAQSTPVYQTEVQGVQNTSIFTAFINGQTGTPVTLPVDFDNNAATIASIDTIVAVLTVQSKYIDPQTRVHPISTLTISVRLNNCSQAAKSQPMSCY